jgi:apolipoprotein N-acyltransferase
MGSCRARTHLFQAAAVERPCAAEGAPRPTHIIWPETALPFLLTENPGALSRMADMLQVGQTLVTGAVRQEDGVGGATRRFYNTIYAIDDEGQIIGSLIRRTLFLLANISRLKRFCAALA